MPNSNQGSNVGLYVAGAVALGGVGWYMEQGKKLLGVTIPPFPFTQTAAKAAKSTTPTVTPGQTTTTTPQPTHTLRLAKAWTPYALAKLYGITTAQLQALNPSLTAISQSPHAAVLAKGRPVVVPNPKYPGGVSAALSAAGVAA